MQASYGEFLRRRGIWHVVEKNRRNMANHPWEIQDFVEELTAYFDSCRTFADPGDDGSSNLTAISRKHAWIAVLNEMVNARRSTSLVSLGLIKFNYKGNSQDMIQNAARELGQKAEDTQALFDLLVSWRAGRRLRIDRFRSRLYFLLDAPETLQKIERPRSGYKENAPARMGLRDSRQRLADLQQPAEAGHESA